MHDCNPFYFTDRDGNGSRPCTLCGLVEPGIRLRTDNMGLRGPIEAAFHRMRRDCTPHQEDALSQIAQIARNAILLANALQRQLNLERARQAVTLKRLDDLIGMAEDSHARF